MKQQIILLAFIILLIVISVSGCATLPFPDNAGQMPGSSSSPNLTGQESTPTPLVALTSTPTATFSVEPQPTSLPATETPVAQELTPTPPTLTDEPAEDAPFSGILITDIQPTSTPVPDNEQISVRDLPIGELGEYVNVSLGYWVHYPEDWYTRFGNRPLLVSFSNLDPGTHNRQSMREQGCLIELNAATNVYGFSLENLMAQLPNSFPNAVKTTLSGRPAVIVVRNSEENPFDSEWIYVEADHRLLILQFEYARTAEDECRPVWDEMLATWKWFEPDFVDYRNTNNGYAISHPRRWFRFNERENGITISSVDPNGSTYISELLDDGIIIHTTLLDNIANLPLKEWVIEYEGDIDLSNDIPLGDILGVRVIRNDPSGKFQEMSGYFQGPLGKIYVINTIYPVARQWEFRPIANAVIYSFSF